MKQAYVLGTVVMLVLGSAPGCDCSEGDATEEELLDEGGTTFWQLNDDSELSVSVSPWPASATGSSNIEARASTGDWTMEATVLTTRVEYRVAATQESSAPWLPMVKGAQVEEEVPFTATATLPSGPQYLQFRVHGDSVGPNPAVLGDWTFEVQ